MKKLMYVCAIMVMVSIFSSCSEEDQVVPVDPVDAPMTDDDDIEEASGSKTLNG